ncbi:hypothetical protein QJQ45_023621 [Haematococcus lacustris]|nr:hypothetical protein QJQ45_023621 [Haematococcus lacustris]
MPGLSFAKLGKTAKKLTRRQTAFDALKSNLFELDLYAYTPTLEVANFSTWVSLIASLLVSGLWLFSVGYTIFLWSVTEQQVSQGEMEHDPSALLVPPLSAGGNLLPLPSAGAMLMFGDGTSTTDPSIMYVSWIQNTLCSGSTVAKLQDTMPTSQCQFSSPRTGKVWTNTTMCVDWNKATDALEAKNSTAANPCNSTLSPTGAYLVPRIAGTFYEDEYSYLTASVFVNATRIMSSPSFASNLYKGSAQLFMNFRYSSASSLRAGSWPSGETVPWSSRVNLLQNTNMKWEISLRIRRIQGGSFWWDIPQLQSAALDFTVQSSVISMAPTTMTAGTYTEVARIFLKLDDRDMQVTMNPFTNLFQLFSDWGGFLSILVWLGGQAVGGQACTGTRMVVGLPSMIFNASVFRNTVAQLMKDGKIVFDEDVRKKRSEALVHSFAHGLKHVKTTERRRSTLASMSMLAAYQTDASVHGSQRPDPPLKALPGVPQAACNSLDRDAPLPLPAPSPGLRPCPGPDSALAAADSGGVMALGSSRQGSGSSGHISPAASAATAIVTRGGAGWEAGRWRKGNKVAPLDPLPSLTAAHPPAAAAPAASREGQGSRAREQGGEGEAALLLPTPTPPAQHLSGPSISGTPGEEEGDGQWAAPDTAAAAFAGVGGGAPPAPPQPSAAGDLPSDLELAPVLPDRVMGDAALDGRAASPRHSAQPSPGLPAATPAMPPASPRVSSHHATALDLAWPETSAEHPLVAQLAAATSTTPPPQAPTLPAEPADQNHVSSKARSSPFSILPNLQPPPGHHPGEAWPTESTAPTNPQPGGPPGPVAESQEQGGYPISTVLQPLQKDPNCSHQPLLDDLPPHLPHHPTPTNATTSAISPSLQRSPTTSAPQLPSSFSDRPGKEVTLAGLAAPRVGPGRAGLHRLASASSPGLQEGDPRDPAAMHPWQSTFAMRSAMSSQASFGADEDGDEEYDQPAGQQTATASILVKYNGDIFQDSDEEEEDFDDVVRHCTSECHALYHLRQVVKLVQQERGFLTCGAGQMAMVSSPAKQESKGRPGASSGLMELGSFNPLPSFHDNAGLEKGHPAPPALTQGAYSASTLLPSASGLPTPPPPPPPKPDSPAPLKQHPSSLRSSILKHNQSSPQQQQLLGLGLPGSGLEEERPSRRVGFKGGHAAS